MSNVSQSSIASSIPGVVSAASAGSTATSSAMSVAAATPLSMGTTHHQVQSPTPNRIRLSELEENEINDIDKVRDLWKEQDRYVDFLENKVRNLREDSYKRENLLLMRLSGKEQDINELVNQINELKKWKTSSFKNSAILDPAVNLILTRLRTELDSSKKKMTEIQEELNAWKFTPDSGTGKRLMAKCRQLLQENEDIGKMIASGRLAKLEGELAMTKKLAAEMTKNQLEMDEFVQELDEDVEGMQSTIYYLQQQLKEANHKLSQFSKTTSDIPSSSKDINDKSNSQDKDPQKNLEEVSIKKGNSLDHELNENLNEQTEVKSDIAEKEEDENNTKSVDKNNSGKRSGGRRCTGNASGTKNNLTGSPRRSTRGQKRENDDENEESTSTVTPTKGRPKRRRGAKDDESGDNPSAVVDETANV